MNTLVNCLAKLKRQSYDDGAQMKSRKSENDEEMVLVRGIFNAIK